MQRLLLLLVLGLGGAVAGERWLGASRGSTPSAAVATDSEPIEYLTVTQMVARARRYQAPTVLVLYGTKCPLSQKLMPGLEQIARRYRTAGLQVHAINVDPDEPPYDIPGFMRAAHASFPPIRLKRRQPGEIANALRSAGSTVIPGAATYTMPVVVVWDQYGTVVAQAQGMPDAQALEQVVRAIVPASR
jgi:thiol-disulfide isomerase/thioredoxin